MVRSLGPASKSLRIGLLVAGLVGLATGVVAWVQVEQERRIDLDDMDRRAHALAHPILGTVQKALANPDPVAAESLSAELGGYRRLIGYAVFRPDGSLFAAGESAAEYAPELKRPVARAAAGGDEVAEMIRAPDGFLHVLAFPL
jgi:hypothetical protein